MNTQQPTVTKFFNIKKKGRDGSKENRCNSENQTDDHDNYEEEKNLFTQNISEIQSTLKKLALCVKYTKDMEMQTRAEQLEIAQSMAKFGKDIQRFAETFDLLVKKRKEDKKKMEENQEKIKELSERMDVSEEKMMELRLDKEAFDKNVYDKESSGSLNSPNDSNSYHSYFDDSEVDFIKKYIQNKRDQYYYRTIQLRKLPVWKSNVPPREMARKILKEMQLCDLLYEVKQIGYNEKYRSLRLSFSDPHRARTIARLMAVKKSKLLKNQGYKLPTTFQVLSPPRMRIVRQALFEKGLFMKAQETIRRFDIIPFQNSLGMRIRYVNGDTAVMRDKDDNVYDLKRPGLNFDNVDEMEMMTHAEE